MSHVHPKRLASQGPGRTWVHGPVTLIVRFPRGPGPLAGPFPASGLQMVLLFSTCREAHGVISTHAGSSEGGLLKAIAQICSDLHGSA